MKTWIVGAALLSMAVLPARGAEAPPDTPVERGIRLYEAGKYDAAIGILEDAASRDSVDGRAPYYAGRAYYDKGDYPEAAERLEMAVEKSPGNAEYHKWLGRAYGQWARDANFFRKMNLAGKIKRAFQEAVNLAPDDLDARIDLMTFYLEAPGVAGGDKDKALEQAGEVQARNPVRGHFALGRVYESQEDLQKAATEYRSAIKLDPENEGTYYRLGYLLQRQEDFDGAFEAFSALARQKPDEMGVFYQIGRNGALSGKHLDESAAALLRYLGEHTPGEDDPSHAWAHCRLGQVYVQMGKKDQGRGELKAALELEPGHKEAKKALKALR
jgi:tetratricopeptide (TPR) repeat protein